MEPFVLLPITIVAISGGICLIFIGLAFCRICPSLGTNLSLPATYEAEGQGPDPVCQQTYKKRSDVNSSPASIFDEDRFYDQKIFKSRNQYPLPRCPLPEKEAEPNWLDGYYGQYRVENHEMPKFKIPILHDEDESKFNIHNYAGVSCSNGRCNGQNRGTNSSYIDGRMPAPGLSYTDLLVSRSEVQSN